MFRIALLLIVSAALTATSAHAVIHAATPPDSLYKSCPTIVTGIVTKFAADTGNLEAAATTLKGTSPGEVLRFKITDLPAVAKQIKVGDPLVLFMARQDKNAALHLADVWLAPEKKGPALFAVTAEKDLRQSYPGTTATLARLVMLAKEGKYDMLNEVHPDAFKGGLKELGKLDANQPIRLYTGLLGTNQKQSLIAVTAEGSRVYSLSAGSITPGKPGPVFPAGSVGAASFQIQATPVAPFLMVLTKDGNVYEAQWNKPFQMDTPAKLPVDGVPVLAGSIGSFLGDGLKPSFMAIKDANLSCYSFEGPGAMTADFTRLTGERLETYFKGDKPFAGSSASRIDVNGDAKPDLLIHTPTRDLLLINRGYGAYFINADIGKVFVDAAGKPLLTEKTLWTAIDVDDDGRDDVVFLSEDGMLRALLNPKPKEESKQ